MDNPTPAPDVRATLTPEQVAAVLKLVNSILATAPTERPPHWTEVDDPGYGPYMNGKKYMLWDIAQLLRKALDTAAAGEAGT